MQQALAEAAFVKKVSLEALEAIKSTSQDKKVKQLDELLSQVAKYRGETARLEVEFAGAKRKCEVLEDRVAELEREWKESSERCDRLEQRAVEAQQAAEQAAADKLELSEAVQGGHTAKQAKACVDRIQW